ncbi:MAG: hypothetical protein PHD95_00030 [Candidatus ainarchaeum sp.]|nr:hypothetical protein [Candidatus ainarchaeum sp.]
MSITRPVQREKQRRRVGKTLTTGQRINWMRLKVTGKTIPATFRGVNTGRRQWSRQMVRPANAERRTYDPEKVYIAGDKKATSLFLGPGDRVMTTRRTLSNIGSGNTPIMNRDVERRYDRNTTKRLNRIAKQRGKAERAK